MTKPTREDVEAWGVWLAECTPDDMPLEEMLLWKKNKIATRRKLRAFLPNQGPLFRLVTSTNVGPMEARPTMECFRNKRWLDREHGFGTWLPQMQPATPSCPIVILETLREATYQDWAAALLGVPEYTPEHELEQRLIAARFLLTLPQMEVLVKRSDTWASTALALGEPGNFSFTQNGTDGVSIVNVRVDKQHWEPRLKGFSSEHQRVPGCHLIVANFDTSQLEPVSTS
jgi:hypothetical protein